MDKKEMIQMTGRELTELAVARKTPPAYPVLQFNKNFEKGDVVLANYDEASSFRPDIPGRSEWGFIWERLDETDGPAQVSSDQGI